MRCQDQEFDFFSGFRSEALQFQGNLSKISPGLVITDVTFGMMQRLLLPIL